MVYYQATKQFNYYSRALCKHREIIYGEMYTEKECRRYGIPLRLLRKVECKPCDTFQMFGCRFPKKFDDLENPSILLDEIK